MECFLKFFKFNKAGFKFSEKQRVILRSMRNHFLIGIFVFALLVLVINFIDNSLSWGILFKIFIASMIWLAHFAFDFYAKSLISPNFFLRFLIYIIEGFIFLSLVFNVLPPLDKTAEWVVFLIGLNFFAAIFWNLVGVAGLGKYYKRQKEKIKADTVSS